MLLKLRSPSWMLLELRGPCRMLRRPYRTLRKLFGVACPAAGRLPVGRRRLLRVCRRRERHHQRNQRKNDFQSAGRVHSRIPLFASAAVSKHVHRLTGRFW
jgi:hypothetical protein